MLAEVGFCPPLVNTRLSEESRAAPAAERLAPPVDDELSQPRPEPVGGFWQGQAITPPAPGSQRLVTPPPPRSWTNTSSKAFASPETRFVAPLSKNTRPPSEEIETLYEPLKPLPWAPPEATLTRCVVPSCRSRRNTSGTRFVSPGTRFEAELE